MRVTRVVRAALFLSVLSIASACGPVDEDLNAEREFDDAHAAIVGGTFSTTYKSVYWLFDFQAGYSCSATLIGSRTLLTAAHCADNPNGQYGATNEDDYDNAFDGAGNPIAGKFIQVTAKRIHSGWVTSTGGNDQRFDIALLRLASSPTNAAPMAWNQQSLAGFDSTSKTLVAVGYGKTSGSDTSNSQRRQVTLPFEHVEPYFVYMGNGTTKGICQGDSGGPSFHTFTDGVERVVGVHSFTLQPQNGEFTECTWGADVRVDAHQTFVSQWMSENETPTCEADGLCLSGCDPVDVDCDCKADGVCSPNCTRPELDADCPVNCAADGVCETATCGRPDADCTAVGQACTTPYECQYRRCVDDSNQPQKYCSQVCTTDADCSESMSCQQNLCFYRSLPKRDVGETCTTGETVCSIGLVCVGHEVTGEGICRLPCDDMTVCPEGSVCTDSGSGTMACTEISTAQEKVTTLPRASATYQVRSPLPAGCTSLPVGPGALTLLALLGLARRRRTE